MERRGRCSAPLGGDSRPVCATVSLFVSGGVHEMGVWGVFSVAQQLLDTHRAGRFPTRPARGLRCALQRGGHGVVRLGQQRLRRNGTAHDTRDSETQQSARRSGGLQTMVEAAIRFLAFLCAAASIATGPHLPEGARDAAALLPRRQRLGKDRRGTVLLPQLAEQPQREWVQAPEAQASEGRMNHDAASRSVDKARPKRGPGE
jgi:hypothetical protein